MIVAVSSDLVNSFFQYPSMHLFMLKDRVRLDAYRDAIVKSVRRGDVVVDVGTGSGVLAFLAARAGARKVYAIERTKIITLAKRLAVQNQLEHVVDFIHGDSREIQIPEEADIILSELIGIFALHENMLAILLDARRRFLKPHGRIVPARVNLYAVATENPLIFEQADLKSEDIFGLDFSVLGATNNGAILAADLRTQGTRFLSPKNLLCSIDMLTFLEPTVTRRIQIEINKAGTLHGIGGWWDAFLFGKSFLTSNPAAPRRPTSWLDAFFPVQKPFLVRPGRLSSS